MLGRYNPTTGIATERVAASIGAEADLFLSEIYLSAETVRLNTAGNLIETDDGALPYRPNVLEAFYVVLQGDTITFANSGKIEAQGSGVQMRGDVLSGVNLGTIDSQRNTLLLSGEDITFVNRGTIRSSHDSEATVVIGGRGTASFVNFGVIEGDVGTFRTEARVVNSGSIDGNLVFDNGFRDIPSLYFGQNGKVSGVVDLQGGHDRAMGGAVRDTFLGGEGDDLLFGAGGDDSLNGGDGNDTLRGGMGDDDFIAGDGDDFLSGGQGNDNIIPGLGDDTIRVQLINDDDIIFGFRFGNNVLDFTDYSVTAQQVLDATGPAPNGLARIDLSELGGSGSLLITDFQPEDLTVDHILV